MGSSALLAGNRLKFVMVLPLRFLKESKNASSSRTQGVSCNGVMLSCSIDFSAIRSSCPWSSIAIDLSTYLQSSASNYF